MSVDEDLAAWVAGLDDLFGRVAGRFFRAEPRLRARAYVRGLLAPLTGKNGWTLAEAAGDQTPDGMQRLLNKAAWDAGGVRDDVRAYAVEHLGDPDGVLIVDETGFVKKGVKSAGVQRQYSGTAGRIENCQLGVFCAYATAKGRTLIDRELYLPKSWTADRDRCRDAGVPDEVEFATKQVLAQRMLARALDAGVPARWVTADEVYGGDSKFRRWLERRRIGYVVAVPSSAPIVSLAGSWRADQVVADAPPEAWKRLSCGDGAKGPRLFDWAVATLPSVSEAGSGWRRWLLARRSLTRNAKGELEIAYYLCVRRSALPMRISSESPAPAGRSRTVSRPRKPKSGSINIKSAATTPGTATSPWPCSPTPISPSRPLFPQKPWQRPHSTHTRRNQASPGRPDHTDTEPDHGISLVDLATKTPAPRQASPLPAKTGKHHEAMLEY